MSDAVDPAAVNLLKLAVQADQEKRYVAACSLYTEGIQLLLEGIKSCSSTTRKETLRERAQAYLNRAEELKKIVENEKKKNGYHEQIVIEEGQRGYGYEKIFADYIDGTLTDVEIDDPYIRAHHQVQLFVRFCAVLVKLAKNLRNVRLLTSKDPNPDQAEKQQQRLEDFRKHLAKRGIKLSVRYEENIHDREIRFDNGWLVKIGRGLDYFEKPENGQDSVDFFELDLRPCRATTIDLIFKAPRR